MSLTDPSYGIGLFVRQLLEQNNLWNRIEGRFVQAKSGAEAVTNVILGPVDATVSWRVFYYWNKEKVDVVWIEPSKTHEVSVISAAMTIYCKDKLLGQIFLDYVTNSNVAKDIFAKYGYIASVDDGVKFTPYTWDQWKQWIDAALKEIKA